MPRSPPEASGCWSKRPWPCRTQCARNDYAINGGTTLIDAAGPGDISGSPPSPAVTNGLTGRACAVRILEIADGEPVDDGKY